MEVIKLKHPVKDGDKEIAELQIRRIKVKDVLEVDRQAGTDLEKLVFLAHRACRVPLEVIEELDAEDFGKIAEKVAGFLG